MIRKFLPKDRPCLILMDELHEYVSRSRKSGMAAQLYNFLQNLSGILQRAGQPCTGGFDPCVGNGNERRGRGGLCSVQELLDRLGKAVIMSAEGETSEIIRRRLFEWFGLPDDAKKTVAEYADWIVEHRQQVPNWFPIDNAREAFAATYPFHPTVLSVFERKWQALPRFQQTRGVLRMLALWVSRAYQEGYKGAHKDQLIGLGTAPLDDPMFRTALFEQLGESQLKGAVTTDICGKKRRPRHATGHGGRGRNQERPASSKDRHGHLLSVQWRPGKAEATVPNSSCRSGTRAGHWQSRDPC